jgi:hypothetical protein
MRSNAVDSELMINTRITQTITATKIGTTLIKVEVLITTELPGE